MSRNRVLSWRLVSLLLVACGTGATLSLCLLGGSLPAYAREPEPAAWSIFGCDGVCRENGHCIGIDVLCPGYDELGTATCSDVTLKLYNPGAVAVMIPVHEG